VTSPNPDPSPRSSPLCQALFTHFSEVSNDSQGAGLALAGEAGAMKWVIRIALVLLMIQFFACGFAYSIIPKSIGQIGVGLLLVSCAFWLRAAESEGPLRTSFFVGVLILCMVAVPKWMGTAGPVSDLLVAGYWLGLLLAWVVPTMGILVQSAQAAEAPLKSPAEAPTEALAESTPEPEMKNCPDCAEDIRTAARKCRFCGYRYDSDPQ